MTLLILRSIIVCTLISTATLTTALPAAEPVRLTDDGSLKRDPRFVNEGKELVYCYDEAPDLIRMMRIRLDEPNPKPMFDNSGDKHQMEPFFSPDGRYIVFTECTGNLSARLVIREQHSKKDAYITHSGRGGTRSPCFSPTSDLVVYAFAETGPQHLWSVKPDGTEKNNLTKPRESVIGQPSRRTANVSSIPIVAKTTTKSTR